MVFNTLSMASSILRSIVLMPNNLIDFFWGSADTLSAMVVDVLARKICWGLKRLFTALRSRRLMYQALQHHNRMEELALIHALSVWFLKFHRPSVSVLVGDDRDDSQQLSRLCSLTLFTQVFAVKTTGLKTIFLEALP